MARKEWIEVKKETSSTAYDFGFEWQYNNSEEEAKTSNKDIIAIRVFATKKSGTGVYNLNQATSSIVYTIGSVEKELKFISNFDFRNQSNKKYFLNNNYPFKKISGDGEISDNANTFYIEVVHNNDGSAPDFKIKAIWNANSVYIGNSVSIESSIKLDNIPRASSLGEIALFNIDETVNIPIQKNVNSYIDNLYIKYENTLIKQISGISNNYPLTFNQSEKTLIKSFMTSPQILLNFELQSLNNNELIGIDIKKVIISDLTQPLLFSAKKASNGYSLAINGLFDDSLQEGLQVYGELYKNKCKILCEKVLFNDENGINNTITLQNNDFSNYKKIRILFGEPEFFGYSSCEIENPDGKSANLSLMWYDPDGYFYNTTTKLNFSYNQVTFSNFARMRNTTLVPLTSSQIKVYKIIALV